ncbi:hypothetical protein DNTS_017941 [Danionella cerebrum]|uniref:Pentraxin (PTX) domain-containing protein n=1 Tax=Danionella cerebrum TaxID=2873325 RepID=A0A553NJ58_9TELE|nr:hypothetical protein DNTS_017941 [Danionella translucida]
MFPELTANSWVKLHANESISQSELSVCLRFYTDKNTQKLSLFSLATPSHPQDFSLSWSSDTKEYQMFIHDKSVQFKGLSFNLNQWNSVCATWEAKTGLAQIFVNEVASIKKAVGSTEPFKGEPVIVLGQYQTQYDGGFSQSHIFQGFLSDVHVHGQVLTPRQIKIYMVEKSKFKLVPETSGSTLDIQVLLAHSQKVNPLDFHSSATTTPLLLDDCLEFLDGLIHICTILCHTRSTFAWTGPPVRSHVLKPLVPFWMHSSYESTPSTSTQDSLLNKLSPVFFPYLILLGELLVAAASAIEGIPPAFTLVLHPHRHVNMAFRPPASVDSLAQLDFLSSAISL